jgi:hypothetical protein
VLLHHDDILFVTDLDHSHGTVTVRTVRGKTRAGQAHGVGALKKHGKTSNLVVRAATLLTGLIVSLPQGKGTGIHLVDSVSDFPLPLHRSTPLESFLLFI